MIPISDGRLGGNKSLAGDLLMLLCQTQIRNDNRKSNAVRKQAGNPVKRGRKAKPKEDANKIGTSPSIV
jgi:hypothetical protein